MMSRIAKLPANGVSIRISSLKNDMEFDDVAKTWHNFLCCFPLPARNNVLLTVQHMQQVS